MGDGEGGEFEASYQPEEAFGRCVFAGFELIATKGLEVG